MSLEQSVQAYQYAARAKKVAALVAKGMTEEEAEAAVPPINTETQEEKMYRLSKQRQWERR